MKVNAHVDGQHKTIDGVRFKNIHSGQKRAYGDSFYEYEVTSDLPADQIEAVCREKIYKAIPKTQWLKEYKANPSADNHFRNHYVFRLLSDGKYSYQVCFPYAD